MNRNSFIMLILLVSLSGSVMALSTKNIPQTASTFIKLEQYNKNSNMITGNVIFESNPNDIQKIYSKSVPAVVKILVYLDFDMYLPNIDHVDWTVYNDKIEQGLKGNYNDLFITYDVTTNYFDILEKDLGREYNGTLRNLPFSTGTGFIINPNGYILTNGHVLAVRPEEIKEMLKLMYISNYNKNVQDLYDNNPKYTSDDYLSDWALMNFMYDRLEIRNLRITTKVVVGADKPGENIYSKLYEPKLIDFELGAFNSTYGFHDQKSLDWALLKIDDTNLPTLPLGDSNKTSIGTEIMVIGYPAVSEDYTSEEQTDFKINIEPTLSVGHVSQITSIEKNKYFQIDSSISPGNSGGPALDMEGNVLGIVTYGQSAYLGGNYNYLQRINDIKQRISDRVQPTQGEIDAKWTSGLEYYWNQSYAKARASFSDVANLYPSHPYVKNLLSELNGKVETAPLNTTETQSAQQESPKNIENYGFSTANIVLAVIGLTLIVLLIIVIFKQKNKPAQI